MAELDCTGEDSPDTRARALLAELGEEPGFFEQAFGLFRGKLGWVHLLLHVVQVILFIAGVVAAWRFFEAGDPVTQLRWGLPASVLILAAIVIRLSLLPSLQGNRIMRQLRRIEIELARTNR